MSAFEMPYLTLREGGAVQREMIRFEMVAGTARGERVAKIVLMVIELHKYACVLTLNGA